MYCRRRELTTAYREQAVYKTEIDCSCYTFKYSAHPRMFHVVLVDITYVSILLRNHTCIFDGPERRFLKLWTVL
jgi:hypothetical protein